MDIIAQLKAARDKAARQVNAMDTAIRALAALNTTRAPRGPRTMSAAARARISASQKARSANRGLESCRNSSQAPDLTGRYSTDQNGDQGEMGEMETAEGGLGLTKIMLTKISLPAS